VIPTGSKLWFGVAGFALVAAIAYFIASDGEEHGSMVLLSLVLAGFTLGLLASFLRDGDAPAPRAVGDDVPASDGGVATAAPRVEQGAVWPALAAVGLGVAVVGLAVGNLLLYLGLLLVVAAGIEWMVQAWSERATGDPARNRELRNRIMFPFEIPVLAAAVIAVVIIAFSRVLLAVPKAGSTIFAIVVAALILAAAFLVTSRPRLSSSLVTGVVVLGAVGLLAGGVIGGVAGEREFEAHGEGEEDHGGEGGEGEEVAALITASNTADFDEDVINVPVGVAGHRRVRQRAGRASSTTVHRHQPEDVVSDLRDRPRRRSTVEVTFDEPGSTRMCERPSRHKGAVVPSTSPSRGGPTTEEDTRRGHEGGGAGVDEAGRGRP
jgi:hypothetical protein